MRRFNNDIVKRTEDARKSNKRAQARLERIVGNAGSFEDSKR